MTEVELIMQAKALRSLAMVGVLATGFGLVGSSAASAMIPPDPGGSYASPQVRVATVTKGPTVNGLRVRKGPGTNRTITGLIYRGDRVKVTGSARDSKGQRWDHVKLTRRSAGGLPSGYVGWVTEMYLY
ncbi:SH3 domain-containing protein [Streptomyces sp. NPDC090080]|uniref:SH3 domain-containing protein n=1 Tax=Streptomyces sp. NPDC090080 TaxID=3365939 RepID=UPI00380A6A57